jgi:hypothetical protein
MRQDHVTDQAFLAVIEQHLGVPEYDRRLSDKILAAFNHAYATGEHEVAKQLRSVLDDVERGLRGLGKQRRANGAIEDAERWSRFVDARDRYHAVAKDTRFDPEEVGEALVEMKDTFRSWSLN